jgi:hypothetical protein
MALDRTQDSASPGVEWEGRGLEAGLRHQRHATRRWARHLLGGLALGVVGLSPAVGAGEEVGPESDWCAAANALAAGEELILHPGEYVGPCAIRRGGTAEAPTVIRARDPDDPPRIVGPSDRAGNAISIYAGHVVIRGLAIGPVPDGDGVRVYAGNGVTIEDSRIADIDSSAIAATHVSVHDLTIRRNEIARTGWTAIYLGCHEGLQCQHTGLGVHQNIISDISAPAHGPGGDPGAGIQIKLNSTAVIRDNVIRQTVGPGIMVYGARSLVDASLIEGNFVSGARTSSAIVVGGGPAIVRNNVTVNSGDSGIGLEDYGKRGLLRGIVVIHNTASGNLQGGISIYSKGRVEARVVNNLVQARRGTPAVPRGRVGVLSLGNVVCAIGACFADPLGGDYSPLAAIPGLAMSESWTPVQDFFGQPRRTPPTAGAIEPRVSPVPRDVGDLGHRRN